MDQLPRLGKRELICLLSFTCNYVVFVWRGFLFLWVLGMGYVILLWHSLSLPYNYLACRRGIAARCVLLCLRDELETSERCLVLMKLTRALILTEALGEYGLTELTSGLQHQA